MQRLIVVSVGVVGLSALALATPGELPAGFFVRQVQQTPPPQRPTEYSMTLENPGSHPRIGFQAFAVSETDPAVRAAAETIADVLAADLEFEREFYVISRKASAGIPAASTPQTIPFSRWAELGADFVLMGSLRQSAGKVEVDVRLISVKNPLDRKDFWYGGCTLASARFCAHAIADDLHRRLRNLDGVARTRIAFTSDRDAEAATGRPLPDAGQGKEIYLMDYDGASQRRLTTNRSLNISPNWGPDGRMLAYSSWAPGSSDIFVTLLDGRPLTRPARGTDTVSNYMPAISPDGTKIAFSSNRGGQTGYYDIWVVNRDGSDLRNITPNTDRWSEGAPTWSPNGAQIAFTSDRTGTNQVFVMNADGTGVVRISTYSEKCDRPTWSALNFIAYTLERPGAKDVAITDLFRKESRILTDGLGSNEQPAVAPNGRHVAFVTSRWGKRQIATVDYPDGKNYRQLTTAGNNTYPSWSPIPGGRQQP